MGDLFFWKGHVGLALNKKFLIHAYGPKKRLLSLKLMLLLINCKKSV